MFNILNKKNKDYRQYFRMLMIIILTEKMEKTVDKTKIKNLTGFCKGGSYI